MERLGVCVIGAGGAVSSTVMAGVTLMKKGLAPRHGMVTETGSAKHLPVVPLENIVFGGWDLRADSIYDAAVREEIVPRHLVDQVKDELQQIKPWPGVASSKYLASMAGRHMVGADTFRDEVGLITENLQGFKKHHKLERMVVVNLTSTEKFTKLAPVHQTIEAFEKGLDENDERISPAMKYLYAAIKLGVPHCNFTPSLSKIPALEKLAERMGVPIAGEDGKTGQTLLKTVLAPAFAVRQLHVDGWYSTNILGNNDGKVLDDPESNKTKIVSKQGVLDDILGYKVHDHQVHIHYYKPRGDAKEAWDNIDIAGFLGERMQIKVNFLCKDSILAAPLIVDLVRLLDVAKQNGGAGIQRAFSVFFKSPYHTEGERPEHDLFRQNTMLQAWIDEQAKAANGVRSIRTSRAAAV
ncbi:MAG TPA: inositol-3-phosphate synthase [Myxococcales bacterium]|nr:inositol-3-phosphate synthase [Myxococcales bacterium]